MLLLVLVFEKCSHRDGFPLHEEHPCPADNLLHLVEDAGKEGDRGEPVSSQPIMEEPENACFFTKTSQWLASACYLEYFRPLIRLWSCWRLSVPVEPATEER